MRLSLAHLSLAVMIALGSPFLAPAQSPQTQAELEKKLSLQYGAIQKQFRIPPRAASDEGAARLARLAWQKELAQLFTNAAVTVEEILKLKPANSDLWQERLETLRLYAGPISTPDKRTVYGASEVKKKARLITMPNAIYTAEALAAKADDEVRIRLVLAADGTVKNILPIRSAGYGLTESAVTAALQIKFEPAVRNGQPVSQFATLVYEFKKKDAKPYIPRTVF
jgi:TonB family protein